MQQFGDPPHSSLHQRPSMLPVLPGHRLLCLPLRFFSLPPSLRPLLAGSASRPLLVDDNQIRSNLLLLPSIPPLSVRSPPCLPHLSIPSHPSETAFSTCALPNDAIANRMGAAVLRSQFQIHSWSESMFMERQERGGASSSSPSPCARRRRVGNSFLVPHPIFQLR